MKPEDLKCHVCNGMVDNECNDPFGSTEAGTGVLVPHSKFEKKCSELGLPQQATMCRKIYQDGKQHIEV